MRRLLTTMTCVILLGGCTSLPHVTHDQKPSAAEPYGMTREEEATILRMEDRREFDRTTATRFMHHENVLHRARMALALARIGTQTFDDANGNGVKDSNETMAGVDLLVGAAGDSSFDVRRNVAFALGEIGDEAGIETLFRLVGDEHADVAAEAVEALSKMAAHVPLERYAAVTKDPREAVRARATRFLFRFASDPAQAIAAGMIETTSTVDRREAVYSLSRRAYAPARGRLELMLTDPDTLTRAYAARALGLIADAASYRPLMDALLDAEPWVRTNAARSIVQLLDKNPAALRGDKLTDDLARVQTLIEDPDRGTRVTAIDLLGAFAKESAIAKERLTRVAVSGDPVQREIAAGAVARAFSLKYASPLPALLETDSPWVKVRAIEGTATADDGAILRARLAHDSEAMVRAAVVGAADADKELALVRAMISDADPVVRATALDKLSESKTIDAADRIAILKAAEERARTESQDDARLSAISALAAIDFPERESFLRSLLGDRDPVARRIAAEAIVSQLKMPRPQFTPLPGLAEASNDPDSYLRAVDWSHQQHSATIHSAKGIIEIQLLTDDAPLTTLNFASLARRHYFDGTSFMRVVPNFVIQGGDPRNDMSGGPGYAIRDEINLQKYTRGAVGMALSGPDTGGSQFFITHSPQHHLDGGYTIFGRVTDGMNDVVDRMDRGDKVSAINIDEHAPKSGEAAKSPTR